MTPVEAHGHFALWEDRAELLDISAVMIDDAIGADIWPSYATALVKNAGMLPDCETEDDLRLAVDHAKTLLSAGVIDARTVEDDAKSIFLELLRFGEETEAAGEI